eukprot:TRINITY_DN49753_c0_g1_i1.p2 TRINITY_DN49753_c0_g1~~TRINITY_DN49753_c0_g1_i1.p2  ORF type:complete len:157 (-),score=16.23 TRINITY_DN49753_c0_g1_i1:904-1374(-)
MITPCGPARFVAHSTVSLSETEIRYQPFQEDFNFGGENPGYVCRQQFVFRVQTNAPLVVERPRLVIPEHIDRNSDYCDREQTAQQIVSTPHGATRNHFIRAMNATIDGLTFLRDHECRTGDFLPFEYTEEYLHGWLEAPISYLLSVSYNFGLCLRV